MNCSTSYYRSKIIADCYRSWLENGAKVLDVGCGNGLVSFYLKNTFNLMLTGCDVLNRLQTNTPFKIILNPHRLPFSNRSFDIIMFNDCLHHCDPETQKALINEAKRVAKKVLIFEYEPSFMAKLADFVINIVHYRTLDLSFGLYPRTEKQWRKLFDLNGFKYQSKTIKRAWFYPFSHLGFVLTRI